MKGNIIKFKSDMEAAQEQPFTAPLKMASSSPAEVITAMNLQNNPVYQLLQEIRTLLLIIVVLKLICLIRK